MLLLVWGRPGMGRLLPVDLVRVLNEYERGVVFRLGRAMPEPRGPGLIMVFGPVDTMMRVDLRTITKVIEPQDIITRDNVSVRVNAVLYFRVVDPMRSVLEVADFLFATSQVALTTLRSTLGQAELDDLLTERDKVNHRLQEIIDGHTEPWGVKVSVVEVKDVDLPEPMKRSMARQAEAERDRGEGHQRRGGVPGSGQTPASCRNHDALSHVDADALSPGPRGDSFGEEFHNHISVAARPVGAVPRDRPGRHECHRATNGRPEDDPWE